MVHKSQFTGMRGVYLVAAKLSENRIIVSPTSRSARGADLLATDSDCKKAFSIQVKTNASTFSFFLVGEHANKCASESHFFVFVNLRSKGTEYFIVPSRELRSLIKAGVSSTETRWWSVQRNYIEQYRDRWDFFDVLRDDHSSISNVKANRKEDRELKL
jgi:hypothetical protein